eukprot:11194351-Lingulodinium_polyedra.AAC.1
MIGPRECAELRAKKAGCSIPARASSAPGGNAADPSARLAVAPTGSTQAARGPPGALTDWRR